MRERRPRVGEGRSPETSRQGSEHGSIHHTCNVCRYGCACINILDTDRLRLREPSSLHSGSGGGVGRPPSDGHRDPAGPDGLSRQGIPHASRGNRAGVDGARVEELLLERLHPFYIEVCRRIRLRPGPEGNLAAVRTSSKAARFRLIYGYFSECSGAADSGDFGNWRGRFFIDVVCISGLSKHWTAVFLRGSASGGSC